MKHIYIYALACAAAWGQCGPGLHLISINGRDYICASIDQTGAGVPTNPCAAPRQFYVDTTNSNLYFCPTSGGNWQGPLGSAVLASHLFTDAAWTRTSATVETLTFPSGGTTFGSNTFRAVVTTGCTVTLAAGGAAAGTKFYTYWDPSSNTLKVDVSSANFNNVTVGAGCTASNTGATGYPQDVVPLGTLAAGDNTVDQWNTSPLTDTRSVYNVAPYKVGSFLTRVYAPATGVQTVALDTTKLSNPSGTTLATTSGTLTNGHTAGFNGTGDIVDLGTGSSTMIDHQGPATLNLPADFADHTVYSTTLPAIAAGACLFVQSEFALGSGGALFKISFGNAAPTVQNIGAFDSTITNKALTFRICNDPGVQNAQHITVQAYDNSVGVRPFTYAAAFDTSVAQNVSLLANDGNGATTVNANDWTISK